MGEIIQRIKCYAESLQNVRNEFLGQATACIGTVHGGVRLNTVPDSCVIEVERRLLPGETREKIRRELEEAVSISGHLGIRKRQVYGDSGKNPRSLYIQSMYGSKYVFCRV